MGYDIYIKCCSIPFKDICKTQNCLHNIVDETYLSYNFNIFRDYWHITQIHKHRGKTISKQIEIILKNLETEGITSQINKGEDGWTATKNVFAYHLTRIKNMAQKYPFHRFYIDCYNNDYSDTESVYSFDDEYDIIDNIYHKFTYPSGNIIHVNNFEKASQIYTMICIDDNKYSSQEKEYWLNVARSFLL